MTFIFLKFAVLKIQQVRQFVLAASSGSFKAAAATTFRSQAAVSIAMRELEKSIGGELIEHDRKGKFTPLAQALLPGFRELLNVHDRVLAQARQLAQGEQGSVSLAIAPFLAEHWLPDLIAAFARAHPDVRIRTVEERSSAIPAIVADGSINIGVAGLLPAKHRDIAFEPIVSDTYGVLCSSAHRFARRRNVTWAALRDETIIGSDAFEVLADAGLPARLRKPELTMTSRSPLLACVRRDLGIAILPMLTRPEAGDGLAFVPLTRPALAREVGIVTRDREPLLPAAEGLRTMLARSLREFGLARGARPLR